MKIKIFIFILLFVFICGCNQNEEKENVYPVEIVSYSIDKSEFTSEEEVIINGSITVLLSNGDNINVTIEQSMLEYLDDYKEGKNQIKIIYTIDNYSLNTIIEIEYIKENKAIIDYPIEITTCELSRTTYSDVNNIQIRGKIIVSYYKGDQKEIMISDEMIIFPKEFVNGDNTIVVVYQEDDYRLTKEIIIKCIIIDYDGLSKEVEQYLISLYSNKEVRDNVNFVDGYKDSDIFIAVESLNRNILTNSGVFTAPILDTIITMRFYYYIDIKEYQIDIDMKAIGNGDELDATFDLLDDLVPEKVYKDFELLTFCEKYNSKVEWYINNTLCDNGLIIVAKEPDDYEIVLRCKVIIGEESKEKEYVIFCSMLTDVQKVSIVANEMKKYYSEILVTESITLPTNEGIYNCSFRWTSYSPDIFTNRGKYFCPFEDITVQMLLTVRLNSSTESVFIPIKVKGETYMNIWDKVESFLERINKKEIKTQTYYLFGCEEGYEQVKTQNIGYLPFYTSDEVKVTEDILPDDSPLKANVVRTSTNYIVLHNTGMAHPSATAFGLNEYIHTTTRVASWHFSIDDKEAYQELKLGEVGWHAGDGSTVYGQTWYNNGVLCLGGGNRNSIGIEMCVYDGVDFNWTMRNTAKLVSKLLVMYNLTPASVRQHYDFSGKDCPQVIRTANRWTEMLELISLEYFARTELSGVSFTFESLNPDIIDNNGTVINNPGIDSEIKYKVIVTYENETKEYEFSSKLLKYVK